MGGKINSRASLAMSTEAGIGWGMNNAIFLSGGGARGAYEVGVLEALLEEGPVLHAMAGASVGAINAVLSATGQLGELAEVWRQLSTLRIYRPRLDIWNLPRWKSLTDNRSLVRRLEKNVHWDKLAHCPMRVFISATNITSKTCETFSTTEITCRHVLASSAIPLLFPPIRIGKHWYIDGAFSLQRPLKSLLNAGADRIFVVFLSPRRPRLRPPTGLFDLADRVLEMILSSAISEDRKQIERTNQEIARLRAQGENPSVLQHKPYRPVEVISIYPSRDLGTVSSYLHFSGSRARDLIDLGKMDCLQVLRRHGLLRTGATRS